MAVTLAGAAQGILVPAGLALLLLWALACALDWGLAPGPGDWEVSRHHPPALALDSENRISVRFLVRARGARAVEARDETPFEIVCRPQILRFNLEPERVQEQEYSARPTRRGHFQFGRIVVRTSGPLGLWRRQVALPAFEVVPVYPALAAIGRFEGLVRRGALQEMGLRSWRRFGEGHEFAGVREYAVGDDQRHLNWRATARMARPMTSLFEPERSRPIWLVLDSGRMMAGGSGTSTKLDSALSAALLLAWVALFRGDRVGAVTVSGERAAVVPMRAGRSHYARILDGLFSISPELVDPDWALLVAQLKRRQGPRALVVVFTDLADPRVAEELAEAVAALRPRHLPVVVTQRDPALEAARGQAPTDDRALFRKAAALRILAERDTAIMRLSALGILSVDSGPNGIGPALLNRYLEIKGRGLL